jgi:hypothetical protein
LGRARGSQRPGPPAKFPLARGDHFDTCFARVAERPAPNFVLLRRTPYDFVVGAARRGPGLRKTRGLPLLHQRTLDLWQSADYRWRELFEAADVMSEGAIRAEPEGPVYYGSTSVLLPLASRGGLVPDEDVARLSRMVAADPHARIRAIRIACLEAQLRSRGGLGRVSAELTVRRDPRGIRIDVEVEASVHEQATTPEGEALPGRGDRGIRR